MKSSIMLLAAFLACGLPARSSDDEAPSPPAAVGYVVCSEPGGERFASMLLDLCRKLPAGRIDCGQTVSVVGRRGDWLEITLADRRSRYLPMSRVSRSADKFVAFDADPVMPDKGPPDCPVLPEYSYRAPRAIYFLNPEYSLEARRMKIQGNVDLSFVVGTDGVPRDIKVDKGLGHGLDEKAVEALQKWRFRPAERDGQPVEAHIFTTISFHLY